MIDDISIPENIDIKSTRGTNANIYNKNSDDKSELMSLHSKRGLLEPPPCKRISSGMIAGGGYGTKSINLIRKKKKKKIFKM